MRTDLSPLPATSLLPTNTSRSIEPRAANLPRTLLLHGGKTQAPTDGLLDE